VPSVAFVAPVCRNASTAGHHVSISAARVCTSGTSVSAHQVWKSNSRARMVCRSAVSAQPSMSPKRLLISSEDLTFDKTDEKDAVLIARLAAKLRCYVPEPVDETWGRLRHLGARREQLIVEMVSQVQQMRSLLECVWPAALDAARQPFRSRTWTAAMTVICERDGGDLARTRRLGEARFEQLVRREITRRGGRKPSLRIVRQLFTALADSTGVTAHRPGALERVGFLLQDWQTAADKLTDTETRMTGVLHELKLTELATSIPGLSAVGAAAILAETGDPNRFTTARALVKHAGLAPRETCPATSSVVRN
jgi:transposase